MVVLEWVLVILGAIIVVGCILTATAMFYVLVNYGWPRR
jgi:hypothetical protein